MFPVPLRFSNIAWRTVEVMRFTVAQIVAFNASRFRRTCGSDPGCTLIVEQIVAVPMPADHAGLAMLMQVRSWMQSTMVDCGWTWVPVDFRLLGFEHFLGNLCQTQVRGGRCHPGVRLPGWSGTRCTRKCEASCGHITLRLRRSASDNNNNTP